MDLLGEGVKHSRFGDGVITCHAKDKVTVSFAKQEKVFRYPDAFSQFLVLTDDTLQQKAEYLCESQKQESRQRRQEEEQEYRCRKKLVTTKIPEKS